MLSALPAGRARGRAAGGDVGPTHERPGGIELSIRLKLAIGTVLVCAAAIGAGTTVTLVLEHARLARAHEERVARLATELHQRVMAAMLSGAPTQLQQVLSHYAGEHDEVMLQVLEPDVGVIAASPTILTPMVPPDDLGPYGVPLTFDSSVGGADTTVRVEPLVNRSDCSGCHRPGRPVLGYLAVGVSREPLSARGGELVRNLLASAGATLAILLVAGWMGVSRIVTRPVEALAASMQRAAAGDLAVRAEEQSPADELTALAASFNTMIGRLAAARAELERTYRQRLVRADRFATAGELASGLAHEIKNPLAGLSGALQVFAEDFPPGTEKAEVVAEMRRQLERLDRTVSELLHFARPQPPKLAPTEVDAVLERVVSLVRHYRDARRVAIAADLGAAASVTADPAQLEQVFLNLCLNAVQAQPAGGEVHVGSRVEGGDVVVEVSDRGPGIPAELRASIFQPFFTTKTRGTGLGLAISARIVGEHHGHIGFECPSDGGTRFFVRLPAGGALEAPCAATG